MPVVCNCIYSRIPKFIRPNEPLYSCLQYCCLQRVALVPTYTFQCAERANGRAAALWQTCCLHVDCTYTGSLQHKFSGALFTSQTHSLTVKMLANWRDSWSLLGLAQFDDQFIPRRPEQLHNLFIRLMPNNSAPIPKIHLNRTC